MKAFKNLILVLLLVLILALLVIGRSLNKNRFSENTEELIKTIQNKNININTDQLKENTTQYLWIDLESATKPDFLNPENTIRISLSKLADKEFIESLKNSKSEILLYADNEAISARAWVILNQMGIKKLLIFDSGKNSDSLHFKFQADTALNAE